MSVYLIAYDLVRAGEDAYKNVHDRIESLSNDWAHIQLSTYVVNSPLTAFQIRDQLRPAFQTDEKLIVAELGATVAGLHKFNDQVSQWFQRNGLPAV